MSTVNVLKSRQQEGCLPACSISKDVAEYVPSGRALEAELVTARARLKLRTVQTIVLVFTQLNQSSVSLMAGNLRRRPAEGNEGWQVVPGPRTFPNF